MNNPPPASKPDDELDNLVRTFIHQINNNPATSNYIWREDDDKIADFEHALSAWRDRHIKAELEKSIRYFDGVVAGPGSQFAVGIGKIYDRIQDFTPKPEPLKKEDV